MPAGTPAGISSPRGFPARRAADQRAQDESSLATSPMLSSVRAAAFLIFLARPCIGHDGSVIRHTANAAAIPSTAPAAAAAVLLFVIFTTSRCDSLRRTRRNILQNHQFSGGNIRLYRVFFPHGSKIAALKLDKSRRICTCFHLFCFCFLCLFHKFRRSCREKAGLAFFTPPHYDERGEPP